MERKLLQLQVRTYQVHSRRPNARFSFSPSFRHFHVNPFAYCSSVFYPLSKQEQTHSRRQKELYSWDRIKAGWLHHNEEKKQVGIILLQRHISLIRPLLPNARILLEGIVMKKKLHCYDGIIRRGFSRVPRYPCGGPVELNCPRV